MKESNHEKVSLNYAKLTKKLKKTKDFLDEASIVIHAVSQYETHF